MGLIRLANGYDRQPGHQLLAHANFILQQMTGNPHFPAPLPSLTQFADVITDFKNATLAAAGGDLVAKSVRRQKKAELVDTLHLLGYYVLFAAGGDPAKVLTSGMEMVKEPENIVLATPSGLTVNYTSVSGELLVRLKTVRGAVSYIYQYTSDTEMKNENWLSVTTSAVNCKLSGMKPGTIYFIRVAVVGRKEQLMYSNVMSKMAV